jgi:hypothetical protein
VRDITKTFLQQAQPIICAATDCHYQTLAVKQCAKVTESTTRHWQRNNVQKRQKEVSMTFKGVQLFEKDKVFVTS